MKRKTKGIVLLIIAFLLLPVSIFLPLGLFYIGLFFTLVYIGHKWYKGKDIRSSVIRNLLYGIPKRRILVAIFLGLFLMFVILLIFGWNFALFFAIIWTLVFCGAELIHKKFDRFHKKG